MAIHCPKCGLEHSDSVLTCDCGYGLQGDSQKGRQAEELAKWAKTRTLGRKRFIWTRGVLGFGIPMAVVLSVLFLLGQSSDILAHLAYRLILSLVVGCAVGVMRWEAAEMQYLRASARKPLYSNTELQSAALKRIWWLFALMVAFAIGSAPLYIYSQFLTLRYELHKARQQWQANGPAHYQFDVMSYEYFANGQPEECNTLRHTIVFRNGKSIDGDHWEACRNTYDELAVEEMFDQVEQELSGMLIFVSDWTVEFDPDFGYVTSYTILCNKPRILPMLHRWILPSDSCLEMMPVAAHNRRNLYFENFAPLE